MAQRPGLTPAAAMAAASAAREPVLILTGEPVPQETTRLGLLPGTFDPPTRAHVALVEAALDDGCDAVVCCVAVRSVGKEGRGSAALRLAAIAHLADDHPSARVYAAATNAGLYVDLADAASAAFGGQIQLDLVCGADKVHQIFDPAYYPQGALDAVLDRLFSRARLLVAPRAGEADPPVHPGVRPLALAPDVRAISSTEVRRIAAQGGDVSAFVPAARPSGA